MVHHAIIQEERDELLAKDAIESSTGVAGFHSNVFVVPDCTHGLLPILHLKWFNSHTYF